MKRLLFILAALFATAQAQTIQTIGAPTTTVVSRGNFRTDSIFYLPKRTKLPTDSGAVRYQISDSSVYYWTGAQWRRLGVHIDTAAMLLPYLRKADTTAMLSPYLKENDTVWLSNRINLKVNISDTAAMLLPYLRKVDTTAMLSPYARTSNVNASLALKVNISDTATMLSPYLKESDTVFLSNRINLKLNSADTASLSNRINLKVNISDTSSMLTNYIRHAGNGLTKSGQSLLVDTAAIATRARVQKAVDSLQANINAKGSGTVTSVATGYGLSGGTITTTGTISADTAILASRLRVGKVVDSLALVKQNVLTNPVTGTGTTNYVPKWTSSSAIGNSIIFDDGTNVGISNTSPSRKLDVNGTGRFIGNLTVGGNLIANNAPNNFQGNLLFATSSVYTYKISAGDDYGQMVLQSATQYGFPNFVFKNNTGVSVFSIDNDGNTGMGNASPTNRLHVTGTARITTIDSVTSPINMLTSDVNGVIKKAAIPTGTVTGSGTTNYIPKFTSSSALGNSLILDDGEIKINTSTDAGDFKLQVNGNVYVKGTQVINTSGQDLVMSNYSGANSLGFNIYLGGGGGSSVGAVGETFKGSYNHSIGLLALNNNTTGYFNNAFGFSSLFSNTTGFSNVALGLNSLYYNTTGSQNIAISTAGFSPSDDIANKRITSDVDMIMIGYGATKNSASQLNNAIAIGTNTLVTQSNTAMWGNTEMERHIFQAGVMSINTTSPNASAQLDVFSTTGGFLPPRMTTTQRDAISSPAAGLVIYNTTTSKLQVYTTSWTDLH